MVSEARVVVDSPSWLAWFAVAVPAYVAIIGLVWNAWQNRLQQDREFEASEDRQKAEFEASEKRQNAEFADIRRRQKIDQQLAVVAELQDALSSLQIGTAMAVMITNYPSSTNPDGSKTDLFAGWFQDWLRNEQRVFVLTSRLQDEKLRELARQFVYYKNTIQSKVVVGDPADTAAIRKLFEEMSDEISKAMEYSGDLYQRLGSAEDVVLKPGVDNET